MNMAIMTKRFTFRKPEHLCLKTEIDALFTAGSRSMSVYPLRVTYRMLPYAGSGPQVKVLLNRAKRQLREAYRLQKHQLVEALPNDKALHIAFIWLSDRPVPSHIVSARMEVALRRIRENIALP